MTNDRPVAIHPDDTTILWAAEAELHGQLQVTPEEDETQGERAHLWVEGWSREDDYFCWSLDVAEAGAYQIAVHYSSPPSPEQGAYELVASESRLAFVGRQTSGWIPDWGAEWSDFEKDVLDGTLDLKAGGQTLALRATALPGEGLRLYTLALTPLSACDRLDSIARRARQGRAPTDWFVAARYGVSFHWTAMTQPRHGAAKPFPAAVRDFDVEALADAVATTGAGYVTFTSTHAPHWFPAPIESIEKILPGNTCERDLIGDLADALTQRDIRLILYYPGGRSEDDTPEIPWGVASGWTGDRERYFKNFCAIFTEIGQRYGEKVAGYWFDFCPFNVSHRFEPLYQAAKTGYLDRLIAWNSWLNLKPSDFQEVWAGETGEFLALPKPEHYQDLQPHAWVYLDDEWVHAATDAAIPPPRFKTGDLIDYVKTCAERKIVVSMNVGVYQDGTVSPQTLAQLAELKKAMGAAPTP